MPGRLRRRRIVYILSLPPKNDRKVNFLLREDVFPISAIMAAWQVFLRK